MPTIKVYKYRAPYDLTKDDQPVARRMGTRGYIELVKGTHIEGTEKEADISNDDPDGKTKIGFTEWQLARRCTRGRSPRGTVIP